MSRRNYFQLNYSDPWSSRGTPNQHYPRNEYAHYYEPSPSRRPYPLLPTPQGSYTGQRTSYNVRPSDARFNSYNNFSKASHSKPEISPLLKTDQLKKLSSPKINEVRAFTVDKANPAVVEAEEKPPPPKKHASGVSTISLTFSNKAFVNPRASLAGKDILRVLKACNRDLDTTEWNVVSLVQGEVKTTLLVNVDKGSLTTLKKMNYTGIYNGCVVTFKCESGDVTNTESKPVEVIDLDCEEIGEGWSEKKSNTCSKSVSQAAANPEDKIVASGGTKKLGHSSIPPVLPVKCKPQELVVSSKSSKTLPASQNDSNVSLKNSNQNQPEKGKVTPAASSSTSRPQIKTGTSSSPATTPGSTPKDQKIPAKPFSSGPSKVAQNPPPKFHRNENVLSKPPVTNSPVPTSHTPKNLEQKQSKNSPRGVESTGSSKNQTSGKVPPTKQAADLKNVPPKYDKTQSNSTASIPLKGALPVGSKASPANAPLKTEEKKSTTASKTTDKKQLGVTKDPSQNQKKTLTNNFSAAIIPQKYPKEKLNTLMIKTIEKYVNEKKSDKMAFEFPDSLSNGLLIVRCSTSEALGWLNGEFSNIGKTIGIPLALKEPEFNIHSWFQTKGLSDPNMSVEKIMIRLIEENEPLRHGKCTVFNFFRTSDNVVLLLIADWKLVCGLEKIDYFGKIESQDVYFRLVNGSFEKQ